MICKDLIKPSMKEYLF